ncbi:MAG: hypothetical protein IT220_00860 [Flavobacteriaceae bacterium]|nr:hypothetical protein [Flavobacteriaceae bacterium]
MKKFHLILFFLFSIRIFSQINVSTIQSNIFKDDFGKSDLEFAESDGKGGVISIRSFDGLSKEGLSVKHYDSNLQLINDYTLDVDDVLVKGMLVKDNVLNLILLKKDKKANEYVYSLYSSDIDNFNFSSKLLFSLDEKFVREYFIGFLFFFTNLSYMDNDSFGDITFSENKNFFAINLDIKDEKKNLEAHKILVFNSDFQRVYLSDFKKQISDRLFDYQDLVVDDIDGTVYFIGKSYENNSKSSKRKGETNYHFEIYKVNEEGQKVISFKNSEQFVNSAYLLHQNNQLFCVGFYSEKNDFRYKGVFRMQIEPESMSLSNQVFLPFSEQFMIDKYGEVKDKELRNIYFRNVFIDKNGDIVINGEEFIVVSYYVGGMNGMPGHWVTKYYYDDIIAVKIGNDNSLKWARNINKIQLGDFRFNSHSYFSSFVNGKDYFFVNLSDNIRKLSDDRIVFLGKKPKKANLYVIVIDENGNMDYKKLMDDSEAEVSYNVKDGVFKGVDKNSVIFQGRKGTNKRFIKVNIN